MISTMERISLAIYRSKIKLDFYDVIVNDEKIKS